MRIVLMGPPGCGKGTQASMLADALKIPAVSTGELFRAAVQQGSELGKRVAVYLHAGELVPDSVTTSVLGERIRRPDCSTGFILDGFPRTLGQAEALEHLLDELCVVLDGVVDIRLEDEEIVRRLSDRQVCEGCGKIYHRDASPPKRDGVCDVCGARVIQRCDDEPETIRNRLQVYRRQTEPLINYYNRRSLLRVIDGRGTISEVQSAICCALGIHA